MIVEPDDAYNQELTFNAHPALHVNPTPAKRYNLVVIGAGPAGLVAAAGAAGLGAKVALVERHLMGGDCLNAGCVPSKALIRAARAAYDARNMAQFGSSSGTLAVDFGVVMQRMRKLRAGLSAADSVKRFKSLGVDVFLGSAQFVSRTAIEVDGARLNFARAAIATGSRAAVPDIPGLAESGYDTHQTLFSLTERPARLVVIGGGPIGCEMAQAFQRLGTQVTLLQSRSRLLPQDDADASALIKAQFESEGIRVVVNASVKRVTRMDSQNAIGTLSVREVTFGSEGNIETVVCDRILVATGRVPELSSLNLGAAGVEYNEAGVRVNDRLRTSNARIYAAGDVCSKYKFTHAADAMARILIQNALFFGRKRVTDLVIPHTTYTDPEVAQVGLTAHEAAMSNVAVDVLTMPLREVDRAVLDGEDAGFGRLLLKRGTGKILGATLVAAHAGEMIGEVAQAMNSNLGAAQLASAIHPYPTQAEVWKKLGDAYNRTRLKPGIKSLLSVLMRWRRGE